MAYKVKAVASPHDASDVKHHVVAEEHEVGVYDTAEEAQAHADALNAGRPSSAAERKPKPKPKPTTHKHK